jgi:hypothetical protein
VTPSPLGMSPSNWPTVPAVCDGRVWSVLCNVNCQERRKYSEETCPRATFFTTNPTWLYFGSNPDYRGGNLANNRLSSGTAQHSLLPLDIVTWRLKAGIAEPDRRSIASQRLAKHTFQQQRTRPLLANYLVSTFSWQKQFSWIRASDKYFPWIRSRLQKRECREDRFMTHVEAGSNTSTVTLRVVGGDGKGSLKSETVK